MRARVVAVGGFVHLYQFAREMVDGRLGVLVRLGVVR